MKWFKFNINNLSYNEYQKWYDLLHPQKKSQVDKFHFADDKKRSVCGDMLAKNTIAQLTNIPAEEITLDVKENGKPYPINIDLHFNVSHCEDYVVCVVDSKPVGIDIEKIRPINLKIAKKFFSEEEQEYIFGHIATEEDFEKDTENDILEKFFRVWTSKEAYLKYTGDGICADLKNAKINTQNIITEIIDGYVITIYHE